MQDSLAAKEDYESARIELNKALSIEPREPIFHALDGDLHVRNNESLAALRSFNKAVELVRMDMRTSPGKFVTTSQLADNSG